MVSRATTSQAALTDLTLEAEPAETLRRGCERLLSEGGALLQKYKVEEIVRAVDRTCCRWLDHGHPARQEVVAEVTRETGMARPVVEQGLDVELHNYRAEFLLKALKSEFSNPAFLDGFAANPATGGESWARGPRLIGHWFSSTIPALPALGIIRGLLIKSPGVGRLSSRERAFAPAFLAALNEELPGVSRAVWLTTWPPELPGCLDVLGDVCDAAIVYGSESTCTTLRAKLGHRLDLVEHGHRVGLTLVGREVLRNESLAALCEACAYDVATFDQRACISPQVLLVEESGDVTVERFAEQLAAALEALEGRLPRGESTIDEDVAAALALEETRFYGGHVFRGGAGAVLLERELDRAQPTLGRRTVRVVAVNDLEEALADVPLRGYLQNVGLGVGTDRKERLSIALAKAGASRICSPGKMPHPTVMWHHDGLECLARLVRWTDIEMWEA